MPDYTEAERADHVDEIHRLRAELEIATAKNSHLAMKVLKLTGSLQTAHGRRDAAERDARRARARWHEIDRKLQALTGAADPGGAS
ncbi:hypothetical protein [Nocardia thailandica]|uniref:hypothetical protein n=1 Tax=Nocardia thailandica TaxID=257275 RepID=UPI0003199A36|nr:hypothetical protein [Nocardia thailandica]